MHSGDGKIARMARMSHTRNKMQTGWYNNYLPPAAYVPWTCSNQFVESQGWCPLACAMHSQI